MVRFTPRPFHPFPEQEPPVPTEWKANGPQSRSGYFREEINFDPAGNRAWDHMSSAWNVFVYSGSVPPLFCCPKIRMNFCSLKTDTFPERSYISDIFGWYLFLMVWFSEVSGSVPTLKANPHQFDAVHSLQLFTHWTRFRCFASPFPFTSSSSLLRG